MSTQTIIPIILWDGEEEIITSRSWVERGGVDHQLIPLLETTAVYRDLLLRDPEGRELADPNQQSLVDRGYRSLVKRVYALKGPIEAIMLIAKINLAIEQCRN